MVFQSSHSKSDFQMTDSIKISYRINECTYNKYGHEHVNNHRKINQRDTTAVTSELTHTHIIIRPILAVHYGSYFWQFLLFHKYWLLWLGKNLPKKLLPLLIFHRLSSIYRAKLAFFQGAVPGKVKVGQSRAVAQRSGPPPSTYVARPVPSIAYCDHSSASNDRRHRPRNTSGPGHSIANVSWGGAVVCGGTLMKLRMANSTIGLEKFPTNPFLQAQSARIP